MNKIKKIMQNMEEEIKKEIEILKNSQFETNSLISQIKTSIESLANRVKKMKIEYQEPKPKYRN
jgi:hypothetical protein